MKDSEKISKLIEIFENTSDSLITKTIEVMFDRKNYSIKSCIIGTYDNKYKIYIEFTKYGKTDVINFLYCNKLKCCINLIDVKFAMGLSFLELLIYYCNFKKSLAQSEVNKKEEDKLIKG